MYSSQILRRPLLSGALLRSGQPGVDQSSGAGGERVGIFQTRMMRCLKILKPDAPVCMEAASKEQVEVVRCN